MPIYKVFKRPTVKRVAFEARFPNLFFIENKIGEYQLKIMQRFPESAVAFRRQVTVVDLGPDAKVEDVLDQARSEQSGKIWQFRDPGRFELSVTSGRLWLESEFHKSYDKGDQESQFRGAIEFAVTRFREVIDLPILTRVGLRYINHCPIIEKTSSWLESFYNTALPLGRFPIEEASELDFKAVVAREGCQLRYLESLQRVGGADVLVLDLDAFAENVSASQWLPTTDRLHRAVIEAFEATARPPLLAWMDGEETGSANIAGD